MTLRPTLASIEGLFHKAERELYRAFHHRNRTHKADHFLNFCITAHAMRDYFFQRQRIQTKSEQKPYHDQWNEKEVLTAVRDIANATKHFKLRERKQKGRPKRVHLGPNTVVDVFQSSDKRLFTAFAKVTDIFVTLSDGTQLELYTFADEVLKHWREFLKAHGVRLRRQSFDRLSGKT